MMCTWLQRYSMFVSVVTCAFVEFGSYYLCKSMFACFSHFYFICIFSAALLELAKMEYCGSTRCATMKLIEELFDF